MTKRSVVHDTFVIERSYPAAPARVFFALSDKQAKEKWFVGPPEWGTNHHEMDFRVGGRETNSVAPAEGPSHRFDAIYQDIIENERIVYSYDMHIGDKRISVSLATIELTPEGSGTRFKLTEQGAYLDEFDDPSQRRRGTEDLLDALGASLTGAPVNA
ncbi:SRPBCC family protein [Phyllobacterium sophorae]|uniref:Polyketide cyclase n=1 Tax=Phyllobacterium sophorae TaxID=1520277 RepID=A0A2P7BLB3_9HYPH|nr:SRPBCC family protein [Phyllobacterium sophorae]PSH67214.1 polyketide cyclase [Phyllobacterium sophorae]